MNYLFGICLSFVSSLSFGCDELFDINEYEKLTWWARHGNFVVFVIFLSALLFIPIVLKKTKKISLRKSYSIMFLTPVAIAALVILFLSIKHGGLEGLVGAYFSKC